MSLVTRVLRDPLTHFLLAGAALFAVFALLHRGDPSGTGDGGTIVVDRAALVAFMQYRSAAFEPRAFQAQFDALSAKGRKDLVDDYVREEAMVREARAMGLDQGDYVMRRRLVQKMEYLIDDAAAQSFDPSDAELRRYFAAHPEVYGEAPTVTFTHVFVDAGSHPEGGEAAALRLRRELEARHAGFNDAPAYGDRFPYLQNYVQRTPDFVQNQFGQAFAASLQRLQPSPHWQGPIRSDYGWHLVLLTAREPASMPRFETVREQVKEDLLRESMAAYRKKATQDLVRRFRVTLKDVPAAAEPAR
jgi:hypothetical protein